MQAETGEPEAEVAGSRAVAPSACSQENGCPQDEIKGRHTQMSALEKGGRILALGVQSLLPRRHALALLGLAKRAKLQARHEYNRTLRKLDKGSAETYSVHYSVVPILLTTHTNYHELLGGIKRWDHTDTQAGYSG